METILPNFLIVGAQKCGTTTLYDILNEHPEANMSSVKEIIFFRSIISLAKVYHTIPVIFKSLRKNIKLLEKPVQDI